MADALRAPSLHRGECSRRQKLADDVLDDLTILFGFGARGYPHRVGLNPRPLLVPISHRVPLKKICQLLVRSADDRREKAGLTDAMLFPDLERVHLKALQQIRKPPRDTAIDTH